MKNFRLFPIFSVLLLFLISVCGVAAEVVVSNVRATQREGTNLVDISYDMAGDRAANVELKVSSNNGSTYGVKAVSLIGAVGSKIESGSGLKITWDAGKDWPGRFSKGMVFTVNTQLPEQGRMVSWDLSPYSDSFGIINMDLQKRFIGMELLDGSTPSVVKRNRGLLFVDPRSNSTLLFVLGENGVPAYVCINADVVFQILDANRDSNEVTWQLLDRLGTIIQTSTTSIAPPQFFGSQSIAKGSQQMAGKTKPPTLDKFLVDIGYGTADFIANSAELTSSKSDSTKKAAKFLLKSFGSAAGFGNEVANGDSAHVDNALWAFNTFECATFLAEASSLFNPATAPVGLLAFAATGTSGVKACLDSGEELIKRVDKLISENAGNSQFLEESATKLYGEFWSADQKSLYSSRDTDNGFYVWIRKDEYFIEMSKVFPVYRKIRQEVEKVPNGARKKKLLAELQRSRDYVISQVDRHLEGSEASKEYLNSELARIPEVLEEAIKGCGTNPVVCYQIPRLQTMMRDLPISIKAIEETLVLLRDFRSSATKSFNGIEQ